MKDKFYNYIQQLQDTITSKLEEADGVGKFQQDLWKRPEGGGGRTRVIENGAVLKKVASTFQRCMVHFPKVCKTILE